jgi:hypothetical protein
MTTLPTRSQQIGLVVVLTLVMLFVLWRWLGG